MKQLIDKFSVAAEIDKLKGKVWDGSSYCTGWHHALRMLEIELNTIETKEVDLEKEISDYLTSYHLHIKDGGRVVFDNNDSPNFMCDIRNIAKYFFKLGLEAKGE